MKIIRLTSENVKRLQAVQIEPDGAIVQITGRNGAGKSSVLDSIAYALGGSAECCTMPMRRGAERARTVVELDDLVVTRTWTTAGTRLTVTNKDGANYPSPQAVLDRLVGKLTLDPLAFSRLPAKQQLDTLKGIVGLDFSALDANRATAFAARTECNRQLKVAQAQADAAPKYADAPAAEVRVAELATQLERCRGLNEKKAALRSELQAVAAAVADFEKTEEASAAAESSEASRIGADLAEFDADLELRIADLRADNERRKFRARSISASAVRSYREQLVNAVRGKRVATERLQILQNAEAKTPQFDLSEITRQISEADALNHKVRENARAEQLQARAKSFAEQASYLTSKIESIDFDKAARLKSAAFPVPDLSFDENGVTFKGVPFSQASSAEQLRASVAIGLALNPKLRVLLVRDGSLLDENGMRLLGELAEENDCQVWLERVSDGSNVGVVIEDGMVAGAMPAEVVAQ